MRQQTRPLKEPAEKVVQDIRRATRKHYSAEEKIRIVLEGLRGEDGIAELCRREGIGKTFWRLKPEKRLAAHLFRKSRVGLRLASRQSDNSRRARLHSDYLEFARSACMPSIRSGGRM